MLITVSPSGLGGLAERMHRNCVIPQAGLEVSVLLLGYLFKICTEPVLGLLAQLECQDGIFHV